MIPHLLGWTALAIDVVAMWAIGHRTNHRVRRAGMLGMCVVNSMFGLQGVLLSNWSLASLSVICFIMQGRAWLNWREL